MNAPETRAIYAKVEKTFAERLGRYAKRNDKTVEDAIVILLRIGMFVDAMPDGSNIYRKRGAILGLDTEYVPYKPDASDDPVF
jgi:hypothetical protein